jgi:GNAT superfamily N-acetyltransferase
LSHTYIVAPEDPGVAEFLSTLDEVPLSNFIARADVGYLVAVNSRQALAGAAALSDSHRIEHLFVDPPYQGMGLGRRLWLRLRDHALRAGNPGVFEVNASLNAVPIYARFGFVIAAPKIEKHGGAYVPMLLQLKSSN